MQSLTQPTLSFLSTVGSWVGIVTAFVAALSGLLSYLASAELGRRSDLRISQNEATTAAAGAKAAEANAEAALATRAAATANEAAANANVRAAEANKRAEELKSSNLVMEQRLLEVKKMTKGREISDDQQRYIVSAARKLKLPDLVVYYNKKDPEAMIYAVSIVSVLQDIGMSGRVFILSDNPPQLGVAYVGTGTPDERRFIDILSKAKVITLAANGSAGFPDLSPEQMLGAEPGSIVVGQKPPGSFFRVSESGKKRAGQKPTPKRRPATQNTP